MLIITSAEALLDLLASAKSDTKTSPKDNSQADQLAATNETFRFHFYKLRCTSTNRHDD